MSAWFAPVAKDLADKIPRTLDGILALPDTENLRNVSWDAMRRIFATLPQDRLRGVQKSFAKSPWEFVADAPDVRFGLDDYEVVGLRLNFVHYLSMDQALVLWMLLKWKHSGAEPTEHGRIVQTPSENLLEETLLALCPHAVRIPPVDIDIRTESDEWGDELEVLRDGPVRRKNPEKEARCKALALDYAQRVFTEAPSHGLGTPLVFMSNWRKGSIHIDFVAPEGVESVNLALACASIIVPFLEKLEIPLLGDHADIRPEHGPAVMADDSIFYRDPDRRGCLWRPCGAAKPAKAPGEERVRKLWIPNPNRYSGRDDLKLPWTGMPEPEPVDLDLWRETCRAADDAENSDVDYETLEAAPENA